MVFLLVDDDGHLFLFHVGIDAFAPDNGFSTQFYTTCHAVPITLRLVGDAMRVLAHTDILDAIIDD